MMDTFPEQIHTQEGDNTTYHIYSPEELIQKYSPEEIGNFLKQVLDITYAGKSHKEDGYSAEEFSDEIKAGNLHIFLVFGANDEPVASFGIEHHAGAYIADMVYVGVIPEARGNFSGQKLYKTGREWAIKNFPELRILSSGSTLPQSTYIFAKNGHFLCAFAPQSVIRGEDEQEFFTLTEEYPKGGIYIPESIYLPDDLTTQKHIRYMWEALAIYAQNDEPGYQNDENSSEGDYEIAIEEMNKERMKGIITPDLQGEASLVTMANEYFEQGGRAIRLRIDPSIPQSVALQNMLLKNGFYFIGISPGIVPMEAIDNQFSRPCYHIYIKVRPDLSVAIPELPTLSKLPFNWLTPGFIEAMREICTSWE